MFMQLEAGNWSYVNWIQVYSLMLGSKRTILNKNKADVQFTLHSSTLIHEYDSIYHN